MAAKEQKLAIKIAGQIDSSLNKSVTVAKSQMNIISAAAKKAATIASAAFAAVKIGQFIGSSINTFTEFEQSIAKTAATAGASEKEYKKLEEAALAMGKATTKTACEASDALGFMALAGWDVDTSIKALEPVLRLSEATQMDLATCSDLVTDTMSAMSLQVEDLTDYLNIATKANNKSNQTAQQLMEAYLGVGGTLNGLNVEVADSATALGVLANRGIKGSEAGTKLNSTLLRLTSGTGEAGKMMKQLGISAFDSNGKFIGLQETLELVNNTTKDMTDEQRSATLAALGGKSQIDTLNALLSGLNTTTDKGVSEWSQLSDELHNADGSLMNMAEQITNTMSGAMAIFNSAVDDAKINLIKNFAPMAIIAIKAVANFIPKLTEGIEKFTRITVNILEPMFQRIKPTLTEIARNIFDVFLSIAPIAKKIVAIIKNGFSQQFQLLKVNILPLIKNIFIFISDLGKKIGPSLTNIADKFIELQNKSFGVMQFISVKLKPIFEKIILFISNEFMPKIIVALEKIMPKIENLFSKILPLLDLIWNTVKPLLDKILSALDYFLPLVSANILATIDSITNAISFINDILSSIIEFITNIFTGNWSNAWQNIVDIFKNTFGLITEIAKNPINTIIRSINFLIEKISSISLNIPNWIPFVGGKKFDIPKIPELASGAVINRPTTALIGEGNEPEAVMPLSKLDNLLQTQNTNITFAPVQNFYGVKNKKDIETSNRETFKQFKQWIKEYRHELARKSFA